MIPSSPDKQDFLPCVGHPSLLGLVLTFSLLFCKRQLKWTLSGKLAKDANLLILQNPLANNKRLLPSFGALFGKRSTLSGVQSALCCHIVCPSDKMMVLRAPISQIFREVHFALRKTHCVRKEIAEMIKGRGRSHGDAILANRDTPLFLLCV
jgi:hypothetical protein